MVASGAWGIATSDDGGATWQPTAIWQYFRYSVNGLATLADAAPGGGDRLVALINDAGGEHKGIFASDDGGDTWAQIFAFGGNPDTASFVDLDGGSALAVFGRGRVWRSDSAGASWALTGQVPFAQDSDDANGTAKWAWQGPDGRLYVGGLSLSEPGTFGYTWRTVDPLAVADEASPERGAVGVAVRPNPSAAGAVSVEVSLPSPSAVTVALFDALGRRVAVLHEGAAGTALSLSVDTSGWAPGAYTVRVTSADGVWSEPFTVVR